MLKFMLQKSRLDFTSSLKCNEQDLELENDCQETGRGSKESDGRSRHLKAEERNIDERDTQTDTEDKDWSRKFA